jgi:DNA-binding transcriptional regulator YhcF (GntR family)
LPDNILLGDGLSIYEKVVWAMLRRYADENGQCFPSIVALSKELKVSVRRVQYAMRKLEELHFLKVTCRKVGAHNYTNSYQLQGFEQRAREQARQPIVSIEDCVTAKGGASRAPGGASRAPGTIFTELEEEKEKSRDLSAAADQPTLSPTASKIMRTETDQTTYSSVQELWNSTCGAAGMPKINKLDGKRKAAVNRLLREHTLDQLSDLFHQAAASDFLAGRRPSKGHANWRATFDFMCSEHVLLKLSEGDYANQPGAGSPRAATVAAVSYPQTGTHTNPDDKWQAEQERLLQKPRGGITRHMESSPASDFDGAEDHLHLDQLRPGIHSHLFGPLTDTRQPDVRTP